MLCVLIRSCAPASRACASAPEVGADDQYGVVAGQGSHHVAATPRDRWRARRAALAPLVVRSTSWFCAWRTATPKLESTSSTAGCSSSSSMWPLPLGAGIAVRALVQVQLVNVARERGLGHGAAAAREPPAQLVLAGDGFRRHQLPDRIVPLRFAHASLTHEKRRPSRIAASRASLCIKIQH